MNSVIFIELLEYLISKHSEVHLTSRCQVIHVLLLQSLRSLSVYLLREDDSVAPTIKLFVHING